MRDDGGVALSALSQAAAYRRRIWWLEFLVRLFREKPLGAAGMMIILVIGLSAAAAPVITPYNFQDQTLSEALVGSSWKHLFGTDHLGRDLFTRVLYGARVSFTVAFSASVVSLTGAILLGTFSGYFGGPVDTLLQRIVDTVMTIPFLILVLTLVAILGPGTVNVIIALSVDATFWSSRIVRGEVLSLREQQYSEAARAMGASHTRIMLRHILPNAMAPIIVIGTIGLGTFILSEAAISFLGFGIPPPNPTWGGMLTGHYPQYMHRAPWLVIWPGVALTATVFAFNMFGDAMRDLLDPRLRGNR